MNKQENEEVRNGLQSFHAINLLCCYKEKHTSAKRFLLPLTSSILQLAYEGPLQEFVKNKV